MTIGRYLTGALVLAAAVAILAGMTQIWAPARGAVGLDRRAEATSDACRALAQSWRASGAVPAEMVISGKTRPVVDLSDHGVAPGTDTGGALQAAFDAAKALSDPVLFLPPVAEAEAYLRSERLTLSVAGGDLCGYGARLQSSEEADIGLGLDANEVGVYGLTMEAPAQSLSDWAERWHETSGAEPPIKFPDGDGKEFGTWASHVVVLGAEDVILRDISLRGAKRGGVRLFNASNVLIEQSCVYRTHSDGIHIVNGSNHVTVRDNHVIESGDDCISVVTYNRDEQPDTVSDIMIRNNTCTGSRTRGITVIGGESVDIVDNDVRDTLMAGVLLYPSPRHNTYPVRDVLIESNRLDGAGLRRDNCDNCGDIVVNDPGGMIEDVSVLENRIAPRPPGSAVRTGAMCRAREE